MPSPEIFERNLSLLKNRWPEAARRVEAAAPIDPARLAVSRCGERTLRVAAEAGAEVWLHSRYRPSEEAERQLESFQVEAQDTVVVVGSGLGYPLLAALRRGRSTTYVVAIEKDAAVLRAAMESMPLDEFFGHAEADLLVSPTPEELFAHLEKKVSRCFTGSIRIFSHPASAQAFPSYYQAIQQALKEFTRYGAVVLRSALYLSRNAVRNRFGNLPGYLASPGIRHLRGKFSGYPAVVVAAGPSLEKNVEMLRRLEGKAVIIAVSTALKILLGRGIQPQLTAIIDYHPISSRYFEGIDPAKAAPLVCDPKASAEAVEAYSGVKLFSNDLLMNTLLDGTAGDQGDLTMGSTVAHAAFHIARELGCGPIILAGLDLSFPDGRLHAAGTATQEQHFSETSRFYTFEMKEWEWYLGHRKSLVRVPGYGGGEALTDDVFFSYLREFESMFQECPVPVIDATEGGAAKRHTQALRMEEAVERFAGEKIPAALLDLLHAPLEGGEVESRYSRALEILDRRLEEARELDAIYQKCIRLLRKAVKITAAGRPANEQVEMVIACKESFRKYGFFYYLLNCLAQSDLFLRIRKDLGIEGEQPSGVERQRRQAERDLEYMQGLSRALDFIRDQIRDARLKISAAAGALQPA